MASMVSIGPAQSSELLMGLSQGCRDPNTWVIFHGFPRPLTENWIETGAAGAQIGTHVVCWFTGSVLALYTSYLFVWHPPIPIKASRENHDQSLLCFKGKLLLA